MEELSPTRLRGAGLSEGVSAAIDRINAAGLADPGKRNWYDVDAEDAVRAAHKLGAAPDAIRRMFSEKPG
jgi:hypothetical protein